MDNLVISGNEDIVASRFTELYRTDGESCADKRWHRRDEKTNALDWPTLKVFMYTSNKTFELICKQAKQKMEKR